MAKRTGPALNSVTGIRNRFQDVSEFMLKFVDQLEECSRPGSVIFSLPGCLYWPGGNCVRCEHAEGQGKLGEAAVKPATCTDSKRKA